MKKYKIKYEVESDSGNFKDIIKDIEKRDREGKQVKDIKYKDAIHIGGNDLEGRKESYVFLNKKDYEEWLTQV